MWSTVLLFSAVCACGDDSVVSRDAGTDASGADREAPVVDAGTDTQAPDAGPDDAGGSDAGAEDAGLADSGPAEPPECTAAFAIDGAEGLVSVPTDTSGGEPGRIDLSRCGSAPGADAPAQIVIAYHVPGSGTQGLTVTTVNDATSASFDTLVAVLGADCAHPTSVTCFDDSGAPMPGPFPPPPGFDPRSTGSFVAMGGDVVHLVVTGMRKPFPGPPTVTEGPVRVDITARAAHAPTLSSVGGGFARGGDFFLAVEGGDEDGDAVAVTVMFLDATGADLPTPFGPMGEVVVPFDPPMTGTTFATTVHVPGLGISLRDTAMIADHVAQMRVTVQDGLLLRSASMTIPVQTIQIVSRGAVCDGTHMCEAGFSCVTGHCTLPPEVAAICDAARVVAIATPTTATTSTHVTGTAAPSLPAFVPMCGPGGPQQALFSVTVPAGRFDLLVVPRSPFPMDAIAASRSCAAPLPGAMCGFGRLDMIDAAPGAYTVGFATIMPMYDLDFSLRPVLATGQPCDPTQVMNRCASFGCRGPMPMAPTCE